MNPRHAGGRPRVARHILIFRRSDRAGYFLHIGLGLYEEIGCPSHVTIRQDGDRWRIQAAPEGQHDYRVLRYQTRNTPYLPVGKERFERLGLREAQFPAEVKDGGIVF